MWVCTFSKTCFLTLYWRRMKSSSMHISSAVSFFLLSYPVCQCKLMIFFIHNNSTSNNYQQCTFILSTQLYHSTHFCCVDPHPPWYLFSNQDYMLAEEKLKLNVSYQIPIYFLWKCISPLIGCNWQLWKPQRIAWSAHRTARNNFFFKIPLVYDKKKTDMLDFIREI